MLFLKAGAFLKGGTAEAQQKQSRGTGETTGEVWWRARASKAVRSAPLSQTALRDGTKYFNLLCLDCRHLFHVFKNKRGGHMGDANLEHGLCEHPCNSSILQQCNIATSQPRISIAPNFIAFHLHMEINRSGVGDVTLTSNLRNFHRIVDPG